MPIATCPATADEAVANGVELLDAKCPDWRERIDTDTLNLADFRKCILGQLGGYTVLRDEWDLPLSQTVACGFESPMYGYSPDNDADTYGYDELQAAWMEVLDA